MGPSLLLTYDFPPIGGSIARALGEIARAAPAGSLVVSTGSEPGSEASDAALGAMVDRVRVPSARLRTLKGLLLWSRHAARLARSLDASFVWAGNIRPGGYPAKWLRERLGLPYGILVHGADLLSLQHRLHQVRIKRGTVRSLFGSASVIVANSTWTRERCEVLLGELGIHAARERVRVVPLGTDPDRFHPGIDPTEVRHRYGLGEGRWLLTVARLAPYKGVDTAIRALALLAVSHPDLRYAVAGRGEQHASLETLARQLGIADRVVFLTEVPDEDLPPLYNVAEIYVGVSRHSGLDVEGFGLALLEASASGVPVVAGRSGGMPDAVRDGETGILTDSEQPEAVAAALRDLLDSPDRARALGAGGRQAVVRYYNWQRVVSDFVGISAAFRLERAPSGPG